MYLNKNLCILQNSREEAKILYESYSSVTTQINFQVFLDTTKFLLIRLTLTPSVAVLHSRKL